MVQLFLQVSAGVIWSIAGIRDILLFKALFTRQRRRVRNTVHSRTKNQ